MKKLRLFIFTFFIIFIISFPQSNIKCQSEDLKLQKLTENLYEITGGGGNVVFLVTDEGVLVIDSKTSPSLGEKILSLIRHITDKEIKYLIYTHYHGDHVQGAQSFPPGTNVIAQSNTRTNIENISIPRLIDQRTKILPQQLHNVEQKIEKMKLEKDSKLTDAEKELGIIQKRIKDYEKINLIKPKITVENEIDIYFGDQKIRLFYMGNAHTNGDLIVYFINERILHTGDLLFNRIIPYIDYEVGSNTENWIKILEQLANLDVVKVIPGHGEITDKKSLLTESEYLKDLRNEVKKYVNQGISLEEIKKKAILPKYKDFDGYNQRFSRNVEAVYLEMTAEKKK